MKESRIRMAVNDLLKKKEPARTAELTTPWFDQPQIPWNEYPRPQLRRESFLCLNGKWRFAINGEERGDILVPYPPESKLSGGFDLQPGDQMTYEREFTLPEGFRKERVILHFGAVDQECTVYLNDVELGSHVGGYLPFSFDVTALLQETNTLRVIAFDPLDTDLPYGKQREDRGGMWYTPVSGIWQSVWLEHVPETYIEKLHIENRGYSVTISIEPALGGSVHVAGVGRFGLENGSVTITPEDPHLWSPEEPYLYNFTVEAGEDKVESYFVIRSLEIKKVGKYPRLCLNGKLYYFHGLLDQG